MGILAGIYEMSCGVDLAELGWVSSGWGLGVAEQAVIGLVKRWLMLDVIDLGC